MVSEQTFEEYLGLHYSNPNTRAAYIKVSKNIDIDNFDQSVVNKFLLKYRNNTVNRATLKAVADYLNINIEIPKQKSRSDNKEKIKFLEKEDIDLIIEKTNPKVSLMVRLIFETGLRLIEIIDLQRSDIDLEECRVRGIGKGQKHFNLTFSTKTRDILENYLSQNDLSQPFHYNGVKHHDKKFWRVLKLECEKIGLKNIHPHRIRHSLGHYLRSNIGFDIEQIRVQLRHKSIVTTQIYANATKEEVERKMKEQVFEKD